MLKHQHETSEANRERQTREIEGRKTQEEKLKSVTTNNGNHIMKYPGKRVKV